MSEATPGTGDATSTVTTTNTPATTVASGTTTTLTSPPQTTPAAPKDGDDLGDAGKRAIADERKARRDAERKAAELAAKVQEFEDAKLSEQERAAKELADAKAAAEAAKAEAARFQLDALKHRIAAEKGVPARLLAGETEDELTASADEALKWRGEATPPPPKAPKPDPSVGPRGATTAGLQAGREAAIAERNRSTSTTSVGV